MSTKVKQVLFAIYTPGESRKKLFRYALVPEDRLFGYPLDHMNGMIVGSGHKVSKQVVDAIIDLYERLGLEESDKLADLKPFLNPTMPQKADMVIATGWAV